MTATTASSTPCSDGSRPSAFNFAQTDDNICTAPLGTWCPNCYDEVRLIKSLKERHEDVLFLSVAFERGDSVSALKRIERFKKEIGISWDVLYGGVASKKQAETVLPFLGGVKSFPTTAFISLDDEVVVHTGFKGPATPFYKEEVVFYENTINGFIE